MSMEREESFFIDIQKSCRFGEFPGLQLFFGQPGTKAPDCGNFVCEKLFQSFHISGCFFQIFPDRKTLRTDFFTFSAFMTLICPFLFREIFEIGLFCFSFISIHAQFIPDMEVLRDIYAERTGHTVGAAGTAVSCPLFDQPGNLCNQFFFFQRKGMERLEGLKIIRYLLRSGQSA